MIDTLLTDVSGRSGDKQSYVQRQTTGPLARIRLIDPHGMLGQQERPPGDLSGLRITGRLEGQNSAGGHVYAARLSQMASAMPGLGAQPATSQTADISSAGRQIARLFTEIPQISPVRGGLPLIAGQEFGGSDIVAIATALKQSVNSSGLFFEAQMLAWIRGRLSKAEVMRNPQVEAQRSGVESSTSDKATPHETVLRQQLDFLAGNGFSWRGEAWPGTDLEWHLQRESPHDDDAQLVLQSDIRLTAPELGTVQARIRHSSQALEITAYAERVDSRIRMKEAAAVLQDTLLNRGFAQVSVRILAEADESSSTRSS